MQEIRMGVEFIGLGWIYLYFELLNTLLRACDGIRAVDWTSVGKCTDLHRHHRWQKKLDLPEAYLSRVATSQAADRLSNR